MDTASHTLVARMHALLTLNYHSLYLSSFYPAFVHGPQTEMPTKHVVKPHVSHFFMLAFCPESIVFLSE